MSRVSAKHALSKEEAAFCRIYAGFGLKNHTEAYRRSFLTKVAGEWFDPDDLDRGKGKDAPVPKPLAPKEVSRRSSALIRQDHIVAYLGELERGAGEHARGTLAEQVIFGEGSDARRAAEKVLESEDKLGFRDAVEQWIAIMCEVGAEIEVPLPEKCHVCGVSLTARAPMGKMFLEKETK